MNRNILVDIDNTLTKLDYTLRKFEEYFDLPRKEIEEIHSFNLGDAYGLSAEQQKDFWKNCEEDIVKNVSPNLTVINKIREFKKDGDNIYLVTARDPYLYEGTKQWLKEHDLPHDKLFCVGKNQTKLDWAKKQSINFDVVFEDSPHYLDMFPKETYKVVIDYPYNKDVSVDMRITKQGVEIY